MRVTFFQIYEIIGEKDGTMRDIIERALALYKNDHKDLKIFEENDEDYHLPSEMKSTKKILNTFSSSLLELEKFKGYLELVMKKYIERFHIGSYGYESYENTKKMILIIDKIISGEWIWDHK